MEHNVDIEVAANHTETNDRLWQSVQDQVLVLIRQQIVTGEYEKTPQGLTLLKTRLGDTLDQLMFGLHNAGLVYGASIDFNLYHQEPKLKLTVSILLDRSTKEAIFWLK